MVTRKRKVAEPQEGFNPYGDLVATLDKIEKDLDISDGSLVPNEGRMSTGSLMQDIVLGGGITAGWYTNAGQEQSCKTTDAIHILFSGLEMGVPIIGYYDFEGCLTKKSKIRLQIGDISFEDLAKEYYDGDIVENIVSAGGDLVSGIFRSLGDRPIHELSLEDGSSLQGFQHPYLVWNPSIQELSWIKMEDIKPGMFLLQIVPDDNSEVALTVSEGVEGKPQIDL